LTGLGNARAFHERLQDEIERAEHRGVPVAVCVVDVDEFKEINDAYGHAVGDSVLAEIAAGLRANGEAFRLGGDEFALVLPLCGETEARMIATAVLRRIGGRSVAAGVQATVSVGIAVSPQHARDPKTLVQRADHALYAAKAEGRNRLEIYGPAIAGLATLRRLVREPERAARLQAAASLAYAVDARDTYTGSHSHAVSELAAATATRMGLEAEDVELVRLAGSLHDVGKLAVPEEILRKPDALTEPERLVLERHPEIGFRMLDSLRIEPVASWVRHHHERWDGRGYPTGLATDEIPLGARIIFVADAYHAMTSDRTYRAAVSPVEALAELERYAGTQFDPGVVAAFRAELAALPTTPQAAPSGSVPVPGEL
jgi:diguanylate cyclase (GGDEF)-like protein/putative nucleotidyltransferase with HDIG domain